MMLSFHRKSLHTVITIIGLGYFVAYATIQCVADWLGGTIPFLRLLPCTLHRTLPPLHLSSMDPAKNRLFAEHNRRACWCRNFHSIYFCKGAFQPRGHWTLRLRDDHLPIDTCRSIIFSDGSPRNAETSTSQLPNVLNTLPRNRCSSPRIHSRRIHRGRFGSWNRKPASLVRWNLRRHHHSSRRWNAR